MRIFIEPTEPLLFRTGSHLLLARTILPKAFSLLRQRRCKGPYAR